jgi:phosphoribosylglycinamide formyltransferase-1
MTTLTPLHDPAKGQMLVAALMSGSGTNVRKLLELEEMLRDTRGESPFEVVAIFSDTEKSNAVAIGREYGVSSYIRSFKEFKAQRPGQDKWDIRRAYDQQTVELLKPTGATVAAYGGYMLVATEPLVKGFLGVNVHPADLSILNEQGRRKYVGDHAVRDAIAAGEKGLRATTHIIESEVDQGKILMMSSELPVDIPDEFEQESLEYIAASIADAHQSKLKEVGDWVVFPRTIQYLAEGRYAKDPNGVLHLNGRAIPKGIRMEDI